MQNVGIKDLQINPAILTKALEAKEYTIITKRSNPIGIAISLDDEVISKGLKTSLLIDAYKSGKLTTSQLARALDISKKRALNMLSFMGIDVLDYDFSDELNTLNEF